MLQIYSLFNLITIPGNTEYVIYTKDYYIDKAGVVYEKMPHGDVYEYGDLIVETPSFRYVFRRVYAAYDYCATLIRMITEQKDQNVITINMDEDFQHREFRAEKGLEVIPKGSVSNPS